MVVGDRDRLTDLVTNLVSNAIQYNRDGGRVSVEVWPEGDDACLRVRRHRDGHQRGRPAPRLRALLPRGQGTNRRFGRRRARAGDRQVDRRSARRPHRLPRARPARARRFSSGCRAPDRIDRCPAKSTGHSVVRPDFDVELSEVAVPAAPPARRARRHTARTVSGWLRSTPARASRFIG